MTEREIFVAALEIKDRAAQQEYVAKACGSDQVLRSRVESLLANHDQAGSFLDSPPSEVMPTLDLQMPERPGNIIGPYKLLQQLGEGGMGTVYLAEQTHPVQRKVALKIIKAGMDNRQVIARFEAERQALALMDHPNIAKVLDAGTTRNGLPYFVMELVKGIPITKYCDQEKLTPRERLELFIPICQAVQHAHQKGIIHRDLKPSNVLIALYDGRPIPKVIDFGVAKATAQKLTERTMFTEVGALVGTLEYMAPEQAEMNNLDIDTRADIYSLGVIVYELLAGSTPFTAQQLRSVAFDEMLRMIREVEPPKPSTKLSSSAELPSIASHRKLEPKKLTKQVHGELDWIVMKCLEKERSRRYETANGLAQDLERYLTDEPVLAGRPSASYRLRRFARRHKRVLATVAALVFMLFVAVGALVHYGVQQGRLAKEQKVLADERNGFANEQARSIDRLTGIQRETKAELYRSLLGQADALRNARQPGYRQKVWTNLHEALALDVPGRDHNEIRDQILACLGDPLSLEPVHDVPMDRRPATQISADLRKMIGDPRFSAVAPDERIFAKTEIIGGERIVSLWAKDGTKLATSQAFLGNVHQLKFTPDGTFLIAACEDGALVWDVPKLALRTFLRGPDLHSIAVDPGSRLMATRSRLQGVELWSLVSNRRLAGLVAPEGTTGIEFSVDGQFLLATQGAKVLAGWYTLGTPEERQLAGHFGGVTGMSFGPDGRKLASVAKDRVVRIWDVHSGTLLHACKGHKHDLQTVAYSADGKLVASGDYAGTIWIWDGESGEPLAQITSPRELAGVNRLQFEPTGKYLAAAGTEVAAWILRKENGSLAPELFLRGRPPNRLWDMVIHPSGSSLAMVAFDGSILKYDLNNPGDVRPLNTQSFQRAFYTLHFEREGHHLTFVTSSRQIAAWNWDRDELVHTTAREFLDPTKIALTADGRWAAVVSPAQRVVIYDLEADQELFSLPEEANEIWSLDWNPDGTRLALGLSDGAVAIWNLDRVGQQLAEFDITLPKIAVEAHPGVAAPRLSEAAFQQIVAQHTSRLEFEELLSSGRDLLAKQSYDEAKAAYRRALELKSEDASAYAGLASVFEREGNLDEALAACRTAIQLSPNDYSTYFSLGMILMKKEDATAAVAAFGKAADLNPADALSIRYLAHAHLTSEDRQPYRRTCEEMLNRFRGIKDIRTAVRIIVTCLAIPDAVPDYEQLLRLGELANTPKDYPRLFGAILYRCGRYSEAIPVLERSANTYLITPASWYDCFLAMAYCRTGETGKARARLQRAISEIESPRFTWPTSMELSLLRREAEALLKETEQREGNLDEAIAAYQKAIELNPKDHTLCGNMANLLERRGDRKGAVEVLQKFVARDPKDANVRLSLAGWLRSNGGRFPEEAIGFYREAAELQPQNVKAHAELGSALYKKGDFEGAIAAHRKAIEISPKSATHYVNLADALDRKGDLDEALTACHKAIELSPDYAAYHQLGRVLRRRRDFPAAVAAFRKAVELFPNDVGTMYYLAEAHLGAGDHEAYRAACAEMLKRFGKVNNPHTAARIVATCVTTPDAVEDAQQLVALGKLAATESRYVRLLGAALYRAGKYSEAIQKFEQPYEGRGSIVQPTWYPLFLAMAYHCDGQTDKARAQLARTVEQIEKFPFPASLEVEMLRREAEALLEYRQSPSQAWLQRVRMHTHRGEWKEARDTMKEAFKLRQEKDLAQSNEIVVAYVDLTRALRDQGKLDEAEQLLIEILTPAVELQAQSAWLLRVRGDLTARAGRWNEAAADFSKVIEFEPENHEDYHRLAPLLIHRGDLKAYERLCTRIVARFGNTNDPAIAERMVKDCLILPSSEADVDALSRMADVAIAAGPRHGNFSFFQFAKGLSEYRRGRYASATEWMQKVLAKAGKVHFRDAQAYMVLALAHHRLGQTNEAGAALAAGSKIVETKLPKLDSGNLGNDWVDWIIAHALEREAKALMEQRSATTPELQ